MDFKEMSLFRARALGAKVAAFIRQGGKFGRICRHWTRFRAFAEIKRTVLRKAAAFRFLKAARSAPKSEREKEELFTLVRNSNHRKDREGATKTLPIAFFLCSCGRASSEPLRPLVKNSKFMEE